MHPAGPRCGRCGHARHGGAGSDASSCTVAGCDCADGGARADGPDGGLVPSLSYSIDPDARLVRLLIQGAASFEDWRRAMEAVLADPSYRPGAAFLVDRRFDAPASPDFAVRWSRFLWLHVRKLAGCRWAIVGWIPASYGVARAQRALGFDLPIPIRIFTDLEEAEHWLRSEAPSEG